MRSVELVHDLIDWDYIDEKKAYRDIDGYRIVDAHDRVCIYPVAGGIGAQVAWASMGSGAWWDIVESTRDPNPRRAEAETIEKVVSIVKSWQAA